MHVNKCGGWGSKCLEQSICFLSCKIYPLLHLISFLKTYLHFSFPFSSSRAFDHASHEPDFFSSFPSACRNWKPSGACNIFAFWFVNFLKGLLYLVIFVSQALSFHCYEVDDDFQGLIDALDFIRCDDHHCYDHLDQTSHLPH